ncbi:MAG: hydrolase 2, exosortase A system-associated [Pseudomonadota bacterium]
MSRAGSCPPPRPFFLAGSAGRLFALHVPAAGERTGQGVLLCPAFAEEMNKTRRQALLQARAFAAAGRDVLIVDLHGTGDSDGDFAEARWEQWLDDLARGAAWLVEQGAGRLCLWGVRLGALQALALAAGALAPQVERVLLWQPVALGKAFVTQFLRLRIAAQLNAAGGGETTASLRERLGAGEALEVAGYMLSPALVEAIDAQNLRAATPSVACAIDWVEIGGRGNGLTPASAGAVKALEAAGATVVPHAVPGEPFWSTPETTTVPGLADAGVALLDARAA